MQDYSYIDIPILGFNEITASDSGFDIDKSRKRSLKYSADLTQIIADIYEFSSREKFLAGLASLHKDGILGGTGEKIDDAKECAEVIRKLMMKYNTQNEEEFSSREINAIAYAIFQYKEVPEWLKNEATKEWVPQGLNEKTHLLLFLADRIEKMNPYGLINRVVVEAGENLKGKEADWPNFGFKKNQDEPIIAIIQTIFFLEYSSDYIYFPDRISDLLDPISDIHLKFCKGLLKFVGMDMKKIVRIIRNFRNSEGEGILELFDVKERANIDVLTQMYEENLGLDENKIEIATDDEVSSAIELVDYFSNGYESNIDALIIQWNPINNEAKHIKDQSEEYIEGKWVKNINDLTQELIIKKKNFESKDKNDNDNEKKAIEIIKNVENKEDYGIVSRETFLSKDTEEYREIYSDIKDFENEKEERIEEIDKKKESKIDLGFVRTETEDYNIGSDVRYNLMLHMIIKTKFSQNHLNNEMKNKIKDLIREFCNSKYVQIAEGKIKSNYLSLKILYSPSQSIEYLVYGIKEYINDYFSQINSRFYKIYGVGGLWDSGYMVSSSEISESALTNYINSNRLDKQGSGEIIIQ